ncbi:hypothetical protein F5H01DRAFT_406252 [Linnemannia elongata]|nr:hypothetical protein F5H01DRAFT_406252 [Linnemannia elongata]
MITIYEQEGNMPSKLVQIWFIVFLNYIGHVQIHIVDILVVIIFITIVNYECNCQKGDLECNLVEVWFAKAYDRRRHVHVVVLVEIIILVVVEGWDCMFLLVRHREWQIL